MLTSCVPPGTSVAKSTVMAAFARYESGRHSRDSHMRPDEAVERTAFEDFVMEEVRKSRSIIGLYPATDELNRVDFAAWGQAKGR